MVLEYRLRDDPRAAVLPVKENMIANLLRNDVGSGHSILIQGHLAWVECKYRRQGDYRSYTYLESRLGYLGYDS